MPIIVSDNELSMHLTDANNNATSELSIHISKLQPPPPATSHSHSISKLTQVSNKQGANKVLNMLSDGIDDEIEEAAPQKSDVNIPNLTDNDAASMVPSHVEDMTDNGLAKCEDSITTYGTHIYDTTIANIKICQEDKTLNVSAFFSKPYEHKLKDGKTHNDKRLQASKTCYEVDSDMMLMFHQFVNTFVYELGVQEPNLTKRTKIDQLRLDNDK
ncbi:hypothetical protein DFH29DRAFT_876555 [Suillus ampliporus]|nr:hypothetical protein DFH29DRAFT_876555 [Suillus ampliporus]